MTRRAAASYFVPRVRGGASIDLACVTSGRSAACCKGRADLYLAWQLRAQAGELTANTLTPPVPTGTTSAVARSDRKTTPSSADISATSRTTAKAAVVLFSRFRAARIWLF
jgi:hypothetical protein